MKTKSMKDLAKEIAKREGKLKEVTYGNIKEVLSIVSDLIEEDRLNLIALLSNGHRRRLK